MSGGDLLARRVFGHAAAPPVSSQVQRKCETCEEEEQTAGRKATPGATAERGVQREVKPEDEEQMCSAVHREVKPEDEEQMCSAVHRKMDGAGLIEGARSAQTKLTLTSPDDPFEQEAEQVAQEVSAFHTSFGATDLETSLLSRLSVPRVMGLTGITQRSFQSAQRGGRKLRIFPNSARRSSDPDAVAPQVESRILQSRGGGQPLPRHVHNLMSLRTGHDFSAVRVKTGPEAAALNESLNARAFTLGSDVWLGKGESPDDVQLMSHELTHVVQQGAARRVNALSMVSLDGLNGKSAVMGYLQALTRGTPHEASRCARDIDEFRANNPPEQIAELHRQILERPAGGEIARTNDSKVMRACGCGGGSKGGGSPACAVASMNKVTSGAFLNGLTMDSYYPDLAGTGSYAHPGTAGTFDTGSRAGANIQLYGVIPSACGPAQFTLEQTITRTRFRINGVKHAEEGKTFDDIAKSGRDATKAPFRQEFAGGGGKIISMADPPSTGYSATDTIEHDRDFVTSLSGPGGKKSVSWSLSTRIDAGKVTTNTLT